MFRSRHGSPHNRGRLAMTIGTLIASVLVAAPFAVADDPEGGEDRGPALLYAERNAKLDIQDCGNALQGCADLLSLDLRSGTSGPSGGEPAPASSIPSRSWLVQAKLTVHGEDLPSDGRNSCGLVIDGSSDATGVLDSAGSRVAYESRVGDLETIALSAVVPERLRNPRIDLRCTQLEYQDSWVQDLKMTALEVGSATNAKVAAP